MKTRHRHKGLRNKELRTVLEDLGMARRNLAETLKISLPAVDHWVAGRHRPPAHRLLALADAVGLTTDELRTVLANTARRFTSRRASPRESR